MPLIVGVGVGILLLVVLACAVAYASGLSAGPSAATGDGSSVGYERKAQFIIAILAGIGLMTIVYGMSEPERQAKAFERQRDTSVHRGVHAYAQYCYSCHGYDGRGAIVPGQGVLGANLTARRATGDRDEDRRTYDFLTKTIARGRPNTAMPAWGLRDGGSLNHEEISELATFIMFGHWEEVRGQVAAGAPTPEVLGGATGTGDVLARGLFASKGCVACHVIQEIPLARGNIGPSLNDIGQQAGARKPGTDAKAYLVESILDPAALLVPGYQNLMPSFRGQLTPEELEALVDYLAKLGTPAQ
jgi:mono/diheme cytochrome c family protein